MKTVKKVISGVLTFVLAATICTGCGTEKLPEVSAEDYTVSADAVSNVFFRSDYEELITDGFQVLYADAADGSYMQTIKPIANPDKLDWKEVLINSGITNTEDFSMLLMSGAIDWKETAVGEATFTYLAISAEGADYAMGIAHHPNADYGIMIYGDMLEAELLQNIEAVTLDETGFSIELGGRIPYLTFPGTYMQSHSVHYFETLKQLDSYLVSQATGIRAEDIQETEETMTFAGLTMSVEGYGVNAKGKLSTSGKAKGMAYAEGIIELPDGAGFLLIRCSQRTTEEQVAEMTQYLTRTEKYFTVNVQ